MFATATRDPGGELRALDRTTGDERWSLGFDDHLSGLAVADGTVYATVVTERHPDGDVAAERLVALS